ncbi:hypothetical protein M271_43445 [Streptomyces rapamycinicus NRRL 5491]|nr:hypothetical protein M271_43445 [Streptomyces rapamycinicus NRRL 5491]
MADEDGRQPLARARASRRGRSGPSPATTSAAETPRRRSSASASSARPGRFSGESREHMAMSTAASPRWWSRSAASWWEGWKWPRSTPSGARTTFRAPIRTNSRAAHSVVQTIREYARAVRRLSRSAAPSANPSGTPQVRSTASALSWETITAGTRARRAHSPVQRREVRSDTSSRSGARPSSSRVSRRRSVRTR